MSEVSEENKPMTLKQRKLFFFFPFTGYTYVFKWNLIVRASRSIRHALFLLIKRDKIIIARLKIRSPDKGLGSFLLLFYRHKHRSAVQRHAGETGWYLCTDVSKETRDLSHPKGGSEEKFSRSQLLLVDTSRFPKRKDPLAV